MYSIETFVLGALETNCYVVISKNEAVIIDPAQNAPALISYCKEKGAKIKYIVLTHGHFDHIGAVEELKCDGALVVCHALEKEALKNPGINLSGGFGFGEMHLEADILVSENEEISFGDTALKVLHTPGHTVGSMSLYAPGVVFTGDALFEGSIGRTDFPGGSFNTLISSIKEKLFSLPDETKVFPGHGGPTTIGTEKRYNFYVR